MAPFVRRYLTIGDYVFPPRLNDLITRQKGILREALCKDLGDGIRALETDECDENMRTVKRCDNYTRLYLWVAILARSGHDTRIRKFEISSQCLATLFRLCAS